MDENIGRVLDALERLELEENTLVVFINDNGGPFGNGTSNGQLRGFKSSLYEGGVRVPFLMRWKGKINARQVIDDPVISLDLLPTFLAASDLDPLEGSELDGMNLLPRVFPGGKPMAERDLYWRRYGPDSPISVRRGNWKLLLPRSGPSSGAYSIRNDGTRALLLKGRCW